MTNKGHVSVNGQLIPIENEKNILEIVRKAEIELPTFCYHSDLSIYGACRLCLVEIENMGVQASCSMPPQDGMKVKTHTSELRTMRKVNMELILANHDISCPTCARSNNCKLQSIAAQLGIDATRFKKTDKVFPIDITNPSIVHDPNKCILCGDCVRVCKEIQTVGAIDFVNRGANTHVGAAFGKNLNDVECVNCGQCVSVCPVGALTPKSEVEEVWEALNNKEMTVIAQIAPAVRVAIGEHFGLSAGTVSIGQIVAALKRMGFDHVYDTSFAADLTVIEEATEFINRKQKGEKLPQFTSCCPSWVKFVEQYYPELIPNLSSCKSPQQMFGSIAKEMLPELLNVKKENLKVISIMPCTSKKMEADREEFIHNGIADVDFVITTEELSKMIAETGINFTKLTPMSLDMPLGFKTGAGIIFGTTGGVTEAVLRFASEKLSGQKMNNVDVLSVRGLQGLKETTVNAGGVNLKLAVVNSLKEARNICESIKAGNCEYDLIEVMSCPGGCIAGGGQPVNFEPDFKQKRAKGLYDADKMVQLHKSQDNPYIKELYSNVLGDVGGNKAHHLLHTHYHIRKRINEDQMEIRNIGSHKINVSVCIGTNCFIKGSQNILRKLMDYVSSNQLDELVNVEDIVENVDIKATFCFEKCDRGPVVSINHRTIEHCTFEKAKEILDAEVAKLATNMISNI